MLFTVADKLAEMLLCGKLAVTLLCPLSWLPLLANFGEPRLSLIDGDGRVRLVVSSIETVMDTTVLKPRLPFPLLFDSLKSVVPLSAVLMACMIVGLPPFILFPAAVIRNGVLKSNIKLR